MSDRVRLERDGAVARIVLTRAAANNAIDHAFACGLRDAARACADDRGIRAILIRSEGKAFCVGGDLAEFEAVGNGRPSHLALLAEAFHAAEAALLSARAPVVTAVQGAAAGAGLSLAVLGDLVLAGRSASFMAAYTAIGLSSDGGSTYLLPRLVGLRRAQEMLIANRRLSADEALAWGLVTAVHDDDELAARAEALAKTLANGPTAAFAAIKRLLSGTFAADFASQTEVEGREIARLSGGADGSEGISAFRAKRTAAFTGAEA